jgi:ATP-dependent Clp protease ATP-binding subunit ClpA
MNDYPRLLDRMTDRTRKVVRLSAAFSRQFAHQEIEPQDLLDALAHMGGISDHILAELGYIRKELPEPIRDADRLIDASESLEPIVAEAHAQAHYLGHHYVGTEHLLLALAHINPELTPDARATRMLILEILGHGL